MAEGKAGGFDGLGNRLKIPAIITSPLLNNALDKDEAISEVGEAAVASVITRRRCASKKVLDAAESKADREERSATIYDDDKGGRCKGVLRTARLQETAQKSR